MHKKIQNNFGLTFQVFMDSYKEKDRLKEDVSHIMSY